MRTVTKKIESDGKTREFPIPAEWERILGVSVMGASIGFEITGTKKKTLKIKEPVKSGDMICAHVVLKDS